MSNFCERIKEERKRLKLSQVDFAELGGVTQNSQSSYELGKRTPDADYLMALAGHGVDVCYVLTGQREGEPQGAAPELPQSEQKLLMQYRDAPPMVRRIVQAALDAWKG